jgi:hypothetical protein
MAHLRDSIGGRASAMDDLAVVLRILACPGKGDDALRDAVKRFGLQEPSVIVSRPAEKYLLTLIAFGGVAAERKRLRPGPAETVRHGSKSRPVEMIMSDWLASLCLVNPNLVRRHHTWSQLIADVANTNGAHLSGSVPQRVCCTIG